MDAGIRNTLRNKVTGCRKILETAISELLEGNFGIDSKGNITSSERMGHLSSEDQHFRHDLISHIEHIEANGYSKKDAVEQLTREVAFTHLNRLCAYKILETRGHIRDSVSKGINSNGFLRYCAQNPDDDRLFSSGNQDVAYRHYLGWLGTTLNTEVVILFSPTDSANRLFPSQKIIDSIMEELNAESLADIWTSDETMGWIYQYFTPKELRDRAREESSAPRNSYELAFRNQFFTPRYVVKFLTDNTLGRIWYEMNQGKTALIEKCEYLVRYPDEVFLGTSEKKEDLHPLEVFMNDDGTQFPMPFDLSDSNQQFDWVNDSRFPIWETAVDNLAAGNTVDFESWKTQDLLDCLYTILRANHFKDSQDNHVLATTAIMAEIEQRICTGMDPNASQEDLVKSPHLVTFRPKKDPRELNVLDPACGSGHFLLYCYDLLETIYLEAWEDEQAPVWSGSNRNLNQDYPDKKEFLAAIPCLIMRHNLHGIDIDIRATQIASLALWLRAQRSFKELGLDQDCRPQITKASIVCAEPMPGEGDMLREFVQGLNPPLLGALVREIFEKMKHAGEAGSLLKIETEIQDIIAEAKKQWLTRPKDEQTTLFPMQKKQEWQTGLYSFKGITDESFWDIAEQKVLEALRNYAKQASNGEGYKRKLFAEDAERGFAFIELCQKQYDVVLMNPPFGEASNSSLNYIKGNYPDWNKNLLCAFIERGWDWTYDSGMVGVIFDRTAIIKSTYEKFRTSQLIPDNRINSFADLGWGVLDANVEVSSLVISHKSLNPGAFFDSRSIDVKDKGEQLKKSITSLIEGHNKNAVIQKGVSFKTLPNAVIGYDIPIFLINAFYKYPSLDSSGNKAYQGFILKSNKHYRLWWEVNSNSELTVNRMFNGSSFYPYISNYLDVAISKGEPETLPIDSSTRKSGIGKHRKGGLCFGKRGEYFCVHILPKGHIFTAEGQAIPLENETEVINLLACLNTPIIRYSLNKYCGQHKTSGYVNLLPFPSDFGNEDIIQLIRSIISQSIFLRQYDEIQSYFVGFVKYNSINSFADYLHSNIAQFIHDSMACEDLCNENVMALFHVDDDEKNEIIEFKKRQPLPESPILDIDLDNHCKGFVSHSILSYLLGGIFGRWDIRYATGEKEVPELPDPFAPLPVCSPGMLQGEDGLPLELHEIPADYPLKVDADGILVDDEGHSDDIIARIRDVLTLLWGENADNIEKEACEILDVKLLRDYFRKPNTGGFWDDHVKRYSKSRRKAPIYWLLQSSKKNYGIWIYYPQMDGDTLYKALRYAKDKLSMDESRLRDMISRREESGTGGPAVKKLEKEIDLQESLVSEMHDFVEKLERAANLNLIPEHDDGVVLTIAPLWELVPWVEPKKYWSELIKGQYEWSSISKQLAEKGLIKRS